MAGWVYAIEFSDGTTKLGRASDLDRRLEEHARNAANFGIEIGETWEAYVDNPVVEEEWLLGVPARWGFKPSSGREWFAHPGAFDAVVREGDLRYGISAWCPYGELYGPLKRSPVVVDEELRRLLLGAGRHP